VTSSSSLTPLTRPPERILGHRRSPVPRSRSSPPTGTRRCSATARAGRRLTPRPGALPGTASRSDPE
jgi:hypothetical protein